MSAEKILKPKTMRRGILALLLVAPLVYMFGSLFFALNGAHEGMDINQEYIRNSMSLRIAFHQNKGINNFGEEIEANGKGASDFVSIDGYISFTSSANHSLFFYDANKVLITSRVVTSNTNVSLFDNYSYLRIEQVYYTSVENFNVINEVSKSNSDYLFGQFFAKDNWVSSLGERTLQGENVYGFSAFSDLVRYADENAFNIGDSDWGKFLYGYATYAVNTLIIYELIAIGVSLLMIPLRITDWFGNKGGVDL